MESQINTLPKTIVLHKIKAKKKIMVYQSRNHTKTTTPHTNSQKRDKESLPLMNPESPSQSKRI